MSLVPNIKFINITRSLQTKSMTQVAKQYRLKVPTVKLIAKAHGNYGTYRALVKKSAQKARALQVSKNKMVGHGQWPPLRQTTAFGQHGPVSDEPAPKQRFNPFKRVWSAISEKMSGR